MAKLPPEELKKLQSEWYARLADEGLEDLDNDMPPSCDHLTDIQIQARQEYYTLMAHAVLNPKTRFKSIDHKLIMLWHADGVKIKTIVERLATFGILKNRRTVNNLIRIYGRRWGIK